MPLTSSEIQRVRDVLQRYDRAVEAADACAVADLFTSYGAYLPAGDPPAFGTDVRQRYQSMFDGGYSCLRHELCEVAESDGLTLAVTTNRPLQPLATLVDPDRNLFALTDIEGQWKIVAFAPGVLVARSGR